MGFPPAAVTVQKVEPASFPVTFEYVGADGRARRRSRSAPASPASSSAASTRRARRSRPAQPLFVIDPKPLPGAGRRSREAERRPRAGAEGAGRPRGGAAEAARRAPRDRPEGGRRRALERRPRAPPRSRPRRRSSREARSTSATRASSRRSPASSSRALQVRGQPRHRQRDAADDDLAGRPDLDRRSRLRERAARSSNARGRRGPAQLPKDNAFDVQRPARRRLDVPAQGPDQLRRHARQPADRHVRDARRGRQRRRRAQARPVRPRAC